MSQNEEAYVVEKILSERKVGNKHEYLVKWEHFDEATWEPAGEMEHLTLMIEEFRQGGSLEYYQPELVRSHYDIEKQFIIRFTPELAEQIHLEISKNEMKDIQILFSDERNAKVKIVDKEYSAKLVDLPTITEAWKSNDLMTYYKSGDISQVLLVSDGPIDAPVKYESGLTAPMKNVLKHWRKEVINVTKEEIQEMIDEVQKILREEEDENVKIEIFSEDENEGPTNSQFSQSNDVDIQSPRSMSGESRVSDDEVSSPTGSGSGGSVSSDDSDNSQSLDDDDDFDVLMNEKAKLNNEIQLLLNFVSQKEKEAESAPNDVIKARISASLTDVYAKLEEKKNRLDEIESKFSF